MKLFADTANLQDIEKVLKQGFVQGITTNPSLLAKEPKTAFEEHIKKIIVLIKKYKPNIHLSIEVFSKDLREMVSQARRFYEVFNYDNLSVKIPIGLDELEAVHALSKEGFSVNCTCCMTVNQAIMAAGAGASYVSFFVGRIKDGGEQEKFSCERNDLIERKVLEEFSDFNYISIIRRTSVLLRRSYPETKIIAGSIRSVNDIQKAGLAGADIITVPPKFFNDMASHFKTNEVVKQFLSDFEQWLS